MELATSKHRAGNLTEARRLYGELLTAEPGNALCLFRCGLLELQLARADAALDFFQGANAADPGNVAYRLGLGQALQAVERFSEAQAVYQALVAEADSADARFGLGLALQAQGLYADAARAYSAAIAAEPTHCAALNNLGNCLQRCGCFDAAAAAYRDAVSIRPHEAAALANLGTVLLALGQVDDAVRQLRMANALEPHEAAYAVNLGIALCSLHDYSEAEQILRAAFVQNPTREDAAFNLAVALRGHGRGDEAADLYRRVLELNPGHADAWVNLGNIHRERGDYAAADAAYAAALRSQPNSTAALNNAACLLRTLGALEKAEDLLRQALALNSRLAPVHDNLGSVLKDAGALDASIDCFRRSLAIDPTSAATHSNLAYALSFQMQEGTEILAECTRWSERFAANVPSRPTPVQFGESRRLRIGYVSPDFRDHCQSMFTWPLLSQHDRSAFEIFCYASVQRPDECTRRLAAQVEVWRDVRSLDDESLAATVRHDGIDILVDLTMHMANGRLLCFARRPAPLQIAWLAYPGTTGLSAMDYRITDPRLDPPGAEETHYSETSLTLPDSFWCYDAGAGDRSAASLVPISPLPALERGWLTLGCLSNPCKLTDATLRLWSAIMQGLPRSRLHVLAPTGRHGTRLSERLTAHGIEPKRVTFVPYRARSEYLRSYHDIDLCLDTFPYNGHTTSLDALWMGVPTISRVGTTAAGRGGLSQLFQVGLTELARASDLECVEAAVALGNDLPRLAGLRGNLRSRLERSPLMDGARFARHMEAGYRHIWARFQAGHGPIKCLIMH